MTKRKDPLDLTRLTVAKWDRIYKPIVNPFGGNGAYDGRMFETYGPEQDMVYEKDFHYVWTVLDVDGELYLAPGRHFVNRFGYFICATAWTNPDLQVKY